MSSLPELGDPHAYLDVCRDGEGGWSWCLWQRGLGGRGPAHCTMVSEAWVERFGYLVPHLPHRPLTDAEWAEAIASGRATVSRSPLE